MHLKDEPKEIALAKMYFQFSLKMHLIGPAYLEEIGDRLLSILS